MHKDNLSKTTIDKLGHAVYFDEIQKRVNIFLFSSNMLIDFRSDLGCIYLHDLNNYKRVIMESLLSAMTYLLVLEFRARISLCCLNSSKVFISAASND